MCLNNFILSKNTWLCECPQVILVLCICCYFKLLQLAEYDGINSVISFDSYTFFFALKIDENFVLPYMFFNLNFPHPGFYGVPRI